MKKILMILGLMGLLNAAAIHAQAPEAAQVRQDSLIAVDTILQDGIRFVQSRDFEIYRGWTTGAAFNLSYADRPGDTTPYRLNITFAEGQLTMKAGETKLILKLKKAKTILELINTKDIGPSDYRSELTKDGTYYYITPSFAISEAQIQQIAADKVSKMRLVHDKGKFDREIQNNAAVLGFRTASAAIQERLAAATIAEPAVAVEAKPEEEESYGYIVDEDEDETYVEETVEVVDAVEEATSNEAVESVEAVETVETVETETTDAEPMTETTVEAEAVEAVETAVEEAVETVEDVETVEPEAAVEVETIEETVESSETTIVEEMSESTATTEVTETVTDENTTIEVETETEAAPETGSEETASETEN